MLEVNRPLSLNQCVAFYADHVQCVDIAVSGLPYVRISIQSYFKDPTNMSALLMHALMYQIIMGNQATV